MTTEIFGMKRLKMLYVHWSNLPFYENHSNDWSAQCLSQWLAPKMNAAYFNKHNKHSCYWLTGLCENPLFPHLLQGEGKGWLEDWGDLLLALRPDCEVLQPLELHHVCVWVLMSTHQPLFGMDLFLNDKAKSYSLETKNKFSYMKVYSSFLYTPPWKVSKFQHWF